jgi:heme-degrading monooxygenase HmoA
MITEIVDIEVKPGEEAAFEAAVAQAIPVFRRSKGCRGVELARTIERRTKYRLFVKWETLEDHTVTFRGSENFQEWRRLAGPFFASAPTVEHVSVAVAGF